MSATAYIRTIVYCSLHCMYLHVVPMQLMGVQGACSVNPSNARDYLMIATQQTSVSQVDDDVTSAPNITRSNSTVFSHPFVAGSEDESSFDCSSADLAASVSVVSVCMCVCVRACMHVCVRTCVRVCVHTVSTYQRISFSYLFYS